MMRLLLWTIAGAFIAVAVHLGTIVVLPHLAGRDAWRRLDGIAADGAFHLLPAGDAILPMPDPAMVMAVCRYDLDKAPLHVRVPASLGFLAVSFYTPDGLNYYALHDRAVAGSAIELTVYTEAQLSDVRSREGPDTAESLRIEAPRKSGLVTIRALARNASETPSLEALIGKASCAGV
jgi:uncharacterized membrane protein